MCMVKWKLTLQIPNYNGLVSIYTEESFIRNIASIEEDGYIIYVLSLKDYHNKDPGISRILWEMINKIIVMYIHITDNRIEPTFIESALGVLCITIWSKYNKNKEPGAWSNIHAPI